MIQQTLSKEFLVPILGQSLKEGCFMYCKQIFLLNIILFFVISGCTQNYEIYGYQKVEKDFDWGHIESKLKGTQNTDGRKTTIQSPYKLFFWFDSKMLSFRYVKILEIKIKNNKSGKVVYHKFPNLISQFKKQDTNYTAFFSFENIELIHDDIELFFKFELHREEGKIVEESTSLVFKKIYQKNERL